MNPITLEQLKELNPTPENPVELVCFDGEACSQSKTIKVITIHLNSVVIINSVEEVYVLDRASLEHYHQKPKEREKEWVFICLVGVNAFYALESGEQLGIVDNEPSPVRMNTDLSRYIKYGIKAFQVYSDNLERVDDE